MILFLALLSANDACHVTSHFVGRVSKQILEGAQDELACAGRSVEPKQIQDEVQRTMRALTYESVIPFIDSCPDGAFVVSHHVVRNNLDACSSAEMIPIRASSLQLPCIPR